MEILGLVVGRNTHTLLWQEEGKWQKKQVANSVFGAQEILKLSPGKLVIVGNREWAKPLCYFLPLPENGLTGSNLRYVPRPKTERGVRGKLEQFLQNVLASGVQGRLFFQERQPQVASEPEHPWYKTSQEYIRATNEVRTNKHLVLATLSVLFPEAVRPSLQEIKKSKPVPLPIPPDIWTKKMAGVLQNPDPSRLSGSAPQEVLELAQNSLGLALPDSERQHYLALHRERLEALAIAQNNRDNALERLRSLVGDHPMLKDFKDSDSALVVVGLLGWRKWPSWRELQAFAGLAVNRLDSKGKRRISRIRPEIRTYLYLLATRAKRGKEIVGSEKMSRVKRIEGLLGGLRRMYF